MALPGYLKQFTVAYYLQALVPHAMPSEGVVSILQGMFRENPPLAVCLAWLFAYLGVFLYLATRDGGAKGVHTRAVGRSSAHFELCKVSGGT